MIKKYENWIENCVRRREDAKINLEFFAIHGEEKKMNWSTCHCADLVVIQIHGLD